MAHFSTILLVEQVKGLAARIDFCKRLEANYAKSRQPDSERPLVKIDGSRDGDTTVTYDKGGWVFWMLLNQMGREPALQGLQSFIKTYHGNPDHPVLQDFLEVMRRFAPDPAAFDRIHPPVVPRGRLARVSTSRAEEDARGRPLEGDRPARERRHGNHARRGRRDPRRAVRQDRASLPPSIARPGRPRLLGKGQSQELTITCPFEPESIIVDPDAKVLQLQRRSADIKF